MAARKARRTTDHLVWDTRTSELWCKRCGFRYAVNLPISITLFTGLTKAFTAQHRHCKAPKGTRLPAP